MLGALIGACVAIRLRALPGVDVTSAAEQVSDCSRVPRELLAPLPFGAGSDIVSD